MKSFFHWVLVLGFLMVFVFLFLNKKENLNDVKYVKIAGVVLKTELAENAEKRVLGLSGRDELKENESMLFVFDAPDKHSFWMKEMNFPIDIVWIAENGEVVYIKKNASPESYPEIFKPDKNALYVLEIVSGFADKNNLKIGDTVELPSI